MFVHISVGMKLYTFIQFGKDQVSFILWVSMNNPEAQFIHSQVQVGVGDQAVDWDASCSWNKCAVNHCTTQQVHLNQTSNGKKKKKKRKFRKAHHYICNFISSFIFISLNKIILKHWSFSKQ